MATIMADQPEKKPAPVVPKHPELLMAAREGDPVRLSILLDEPVVAWTAIDIQDGGGGGNPVRHAEAVTSGLDSILHVVASGGDGDQFLESASVIHSKARHLLNAGNSEGDTPLHCAARAGRIEMVSQLIRLARAEAGDERVKAALRKQIEQAERDGAARGRSAGRQGDGREVDVGGSAARSAAGGGWRLALVPGRLTGT